MHDNLIIWYSNNIRTLQFIPSTTPIHFGKRRSITKLFGYNYEKRNPFDWYHKSSYSGRYLNFLSNHSISPKRGTIISLVDKALLLSGAENHTKNLIVINTLLLENDYPLDFICNTIKKRIHNLIKQKIETRVRSNNEIEPNRTSWFTSIYTFYYREI